MPSPVVPLDRLTRAAASATDGQSPSETLGRFAVPRSVGRALRNAAESTGVGFEVLAAKAAIESGFQPAAQAPSSSARGLFQFIDQTWLDAVRQHGAAHGLAQEAAAITRSASGHLTVAEPAERARILALRDNPEISARLGAEHLKDISDALAPVLGRKPDVGELYLGHFLGTGGATKLLRAVAAEPGRAASDLLPEAARANTTLFRGGDGAPFSAQQFLENIRGKVGQVYAQLGLQAPVGPVEFAAVTTEARPGEAIASAEPFWWGSGAPARVAHAPERMMASALVEVFNRMGRGQAAQESGTASAEGNRLPGSLLEALREEAVPTPAGTARRAYGGASA
ncbi:lytic transglycosylase domain-containing protein [Pseudoroseomonas wenyumeiae]|uniref:Lytic transglycosylase domain-containing protein n=1 Tax=Teichococcus wenyumeiae TaxID=2478470 RepID=A0A3A9J7T9_9PROT|nr:transglycosylase SLT domain-containing protein [Pseudoroseomonas wenyumeiae]RKK02020.1 lytic transglycosylase domain-containing protein [Pseudoroseomonas wenyumeiae]RMI20154.1 lytic transglycosylase domain-containing protein [Pseudoroseomonas wenyumeiae]